MKILTCFIMKNENAKNLKIFNILALRFNSRIFISKKNTDV